MKPMYYFQLYILNLELILLRIIYNQTHVRIENLRVKLGEYWRKLYWIS